MLYILHGASLTCFWHLSPCQNLQMLFSPRLVCILLSSIDISVYSYTNTIPDNYLNEDLHDNHPLKRLLWLPLFKSAVLILFCAWVLVFKLPWYFILLHSIQPADGRIVFSNGSFKGPVILDEFLPWRERWLNKQHLFLIKKQINVRNRQPH